MDSKALVMSLTNPERTQFCSSAAKKLPPEPEQGTSIPGRNPLIPSPNRGCR